MNSIKYGVHAKKNFKWSSITGSDVWAACMVHGYESGKVQKTCAEENVVESNERVLNGVGCGFVYASRSDYDRFVYYEEE